MKKRAKMKRLAIMNKYLREIRAHGLTVQVTFSYWRDQSMTFPMPPAPEAVWSVTWTGKYDLHESCMGTAETVVFLRGAAWAADYTEHTLTDYSRRTA